MSFIIEWNRTGGKCFKFTSSVEAVNIGLNRRKASNIMAKIVKPVRFSKFFRLDEALLRKLGVLDPTLNVDTKLFMDPLLFEESAHPEIAQGAQATYEEYFTKVIKFLRAANDPDGVAWRTAKRLLSFPEIKWTCLGYGAGSVSGSGSGDRMTAQMAQTGKEIVDLGVDDPDLFAAMALFEENFGPDHISDMVANVVLGDLIKFNERILSNFSIPREKVKLSLRNGNSFEAILPVNPCLRGNVRPVILVPLDILRELPISTDWSDVADAAAQNQELRDRVNTHIAELWKSRTLKDKDEVRRWALQKKDSFTDFMDMVHSAEKSAYDSEHDPAGELFWRGLADKLRNEGLQALNIPAQLDLNGVVSIVEQIIERFRFHIEDRRLSEELYANGKPRPEKAAQRLFYVVADAYCAANNLDLTPEAETGNGPVDFKVSQGRGRVLVEIKLSKGKVVTGYTRQLERYKTAEETTKGFYLVLDVGTMGKKKAQLLAAKNAATALGETTSPIVFIDGTRKPSASKL